MDIFDFVADMEEPIDFIVYAGDDIARFEDEGVNYFTELSEYTTQKKVLAVIGNDESLLVKNILDSKNVYDLHREPFIFEDFAFIGQEASTRGPARVKYSERYVKEHLKKQHKLAKGKKILIVSHTPPHGVLDLGLRFADSDEGYNNIGSTSLRDFIQTKKPRLVVCGHCHSHGGLSENFKSTTVVNVASHDSPGSKGKFAVIEVNKNQITIKWHDTFEMIKKDSLMFLHNVGFQRKTEMNKAGILSIKELAEAKNLDEITKKSNFSLNFLQKLQLKAKSVMENQIYQVAPFSLPEKPIFFDIETDIACRRVWLIGVLKDGKFTKFYAENWRHEKRNLKKFVKFLEDNPENTMVSYSGTCFDQNVLQRALSRQGIDYSLFGHEHVDLCQILRRSYIFPNQSFALKNLGGFLGYPFKHSDIDGLFVALEYQRHVSKKKPIDLKVFEYNEDDVRSLPFIIDKVTNLLELKIDSGKKGKGREG